jgi:hypothetical protein
MQHASYNLEWKFKERKEMNNSKMAYITLVVLRRSPRCWLNGRLIEWTNLRYSPDCTKFIRIELENYTNKDDD